MTEIIRKWVKPPTTRNAKESEKHFPHFLVENQKDVVHHHVDDLDN